jgi:prepilin-type N-terminal cleavage/methylation domain-containing protein
MKRLQFDVKQTQGFSLLEVAVVMIIMAILITAIGIPLATQLDQQKTKDTEKQLELVKEAIYGFAMANGRLPCPASASSAGQERFCSVDSAAACGAAQPAYSANGRCFTSSSVPPVDGFVPTATLGLAPVDSGGFMQDGWADGTAARRLRYATSTNTVGVVTNVLTQTDGIKSATMASVAGAASFFYICAPGLTTVSTTNCGTAQELTRLAPFVVYSLGKDAGSATFDSANNQNNDIVFTSGGQTAGFDDIVTWGSLNTLFARMVQAGKLP